MTPEDTIEGDKLISEFMGLEYGKQYAVRDEVTRLITLVAPRYSSSWDWLMPVILKIAKMGYSIELNFTKSDASAHIRGEESLHCTYYSNPIEAAYTLCVQFIKWYNDNKK